MSNQYPEGTKVEWDWGDGTATGEIRAVHTEKITKTIKGAEVTREANADKPAYTIVQEDGDEVLKSDSEIRKT